MELPCLVTPSCLAPWVWLQLPDLACLAHLNTQYPLHPQMSPTDVKVGGHELKCHKPFQNTFHWKYLSPPTPHNNFCPFLQNLEAHFDAEILFPGRRFMSVIWRIEDPLPPTAQPAVKLRGLKKLHQTVTCVFLQEQWQNKLLFCLVLFPIYKTSWAPDPRLLAFSLMLMSADPPTLSQWLQDKLATPDKAVCEWGYPGKVNLAGRLPGLGKPAPPPPPSQRRIFHFKEEWDGRDILRIGKCFGTSESLLSLLNFRSAFYSEINSSKI